VDENRLDIIGVAKFPDVKLYGHQVFPGYAVESAGGLIHAPCLV
jgi:hypothetical protein